MEGLYLFKATDKETAAFFHLPWKRKTHQHQIKCDKKEEKLSLVVRVLETLFSFSFFLDFQNNRKKKPFQNDFNKKESDV